MLVKSDSTALRSATKSRMFARRSGMGYVPQGREIFGALTVAENLQVGAQANRAQAAQMKEKVVGYFPILKKRYTQKAGTMSGGEQQQLAIARALISAPQGPAAR